MKAAQAFNNDGEILRADILLIHIGQWTNGWRQILVKIGHSDTKSNWRSSGSPKLSKSKNAWRDVLSSSEAGGKSLTRSTQRAGGTQSLCLETVQRILPSFY